jgi:hypothetical protein
MGLKDVAGVFSRKFIVGFFIPAFFIVLGLTQLVDRRTLPAAYLDASGGAQMLIVGNFTSIVITGDNTTEGIAVAAGDKKLDADVVSPHEMHVELPDDVLEHGRTRLEIGSFELSNVWADVDLSAVPLLDVDAPPQEPLAEGLAGNGDTNYRAVNRAASPEPLVASPAL